MEKEKEAEKAKNVRRAAKSAFTRVINTTQLLLDAKRPLSEIRDEFEKVKVVHADHIKKHEAYTMFLSDEEYPEAENWMEECSFKFVDFSIRVNDYCQSNAINVQEKDEEHSAASGEIIEDHGSQDEVQKTSEIDQSNAAKHAPAKPLLMKHEKPKLPTFNGDVRKYFIFKADFQHAVESYYSERDAIAILRSCLGPEPSKLVDGISTDLKAAWNYLDQNYGDPRVVSNVVTADLERFKAIQPGEDHRFCELVNLVRRSYNILKEVKRPQDIDNTHVISLIERKMPKDDLRVWARHIYVQKLEPSMTNLLRWMDKEMTARLRSGAAVRKTGNLRTSVNALGTGGNDHNSQDANRNKSSGHCYVCKANHYVDQCPRFQTMTPNERWEVVKEQKACFSCLKKGKGHTTANCLRKKECSEKNRDGTVCKRPHHKLLHTENSSPVQVSSLQDKGKALLLVIIGSVKMPSSVDAFTEASVFYDSGAQISMVRSSFAESLCLESKPVKIIITKVGGVEEELATKVYKIPICTVHGKPVQTIQAVGIPQISNEVEEVDTTVLASMFGLVASEVRRKAGPIDLLIGINYSRFHVGETKVNASLVARRSPLGWVIFGSNAEDVMPEIKQVSLVSLVPPVDLTDFWRTESMGVSVSPCTCEASKLSAQEREELKIIEESAKLQGNKWTMKYPWKRDPSSLPNNYPQVRKKLETIERRLMKHPENAASYDKQIKEMEEMQFARKLTPKEIEEWKGPVHYVAHHAVLRPEKKSTPVRIVFNSSASYAGHTLNDYWYKGPDLLNNLFGVVIPFHKNLVAICSHIAKMYHMIEIPDNNRHMSTSSCG